MDIKTDYYWITENENPISRWDITIHFKVETTKELWSYLKELVGVEDSYMRDTKMVIEIGEMYSLEEIAAGLKEKLDYYLQGQEKRNTLKEKTMLFDELTQHKRDLHEAVVIEDYERAATLRDEIQFLIKSK